MTVQPLGFLCPAGPAQFEFLIHFCGRPSSTAMTLTVPNDPGHAAVAAQRTPTASNRRSSMKVRGRSSPALVSSGDCSAGFRLRVGMRGSGVGSRLAAGHPGRAWPGRSRRPRDHGCARKEGCRQGCPFGVVVGWGKVAFTRVWTSAGGRPSARLPIIHPPRVEGMVCCDRDRMGLNQQRGRATSRWGPDLRRARLSGHVRACSRRPRPGLAQGADVPVVQAVGPPRRWRCCDPDGR